MIRRLPPVLFLVLGVLSGFTLLAGAVSYTTDALIELEHGSPGGPNCSLRKWRSWIAITSTWSAPWRSPLPQERHST